MYHPVKIIQDFTKSVAGLWLNPQTKNQFYFSADQSDSSKGEINVIQQGSDTPIPLHFNLITKGEKLFITVEGSEYDVSLTEIPVHSLYITLSPGNTLRLLKK
jgi:hypothetical protein